jgi:hypothetical protein
VGPVDVRNRDPRSAAASSLEDVLSKIAALSELLQALVVSEACHSPMAVVRSGGGSHMS